MIRAGISTITPIICASACHGGTPTSAIGTAIPPRPSRPAIRPRGADGIGMNATTTLKKPTAASISGGNRAVPAPSRIVFQLNTRSGDVVSGVANAASSATPHRNIIARRLSRQGSIGRITREVCDDEKYGGGCAAGIAIIGACGERIGTAIAIGCCGAGGTNVACIAGGGALGERYAGWAGGTGAGWPGGAWTNIVLALAELAGTNAFGGPDGA